MRSSGGNGRYFDELEFQVKINQEQLDELRDLLYIARLRFIFFLTLFLIALIGLLIGAYLFVIGEFFYFFERHSTIINVSAVFLVFGLIEVFSYFSSSIVILRHIRRLIKRQIEALSAARIELKGH